jgi:hypothetical protein
MDYAPPIRSAKTEQEEAMPKYTFMVLTNPVEGQDDTYNDWYTNRHLADVLNVPGFVSAQRFKLADAQRGNPPHPWRYLALYQIETDDLKKTLATLSERSGTEAMVISDAVAPERMGFVYEAITPPVEAKH